MANLLSTADLSRHEIDALISTAPALAPHEADAGIHSSRTVGLMFFEESMRTRLGFAAAAGRLRATTLEVVSGKRVTSMSAGESDIDVARCVGAWCDVVCVRHPDEAFARTLAEILELPVINCGNGRDEHPTQALIDLRAIVESLGAVDHARIAIVGDLRSMRSAHSLILALARYHAVTVRAIAPPGLELPTEYARRITGSGLRLEQAEALELEDIDLVYAAGLSERTAAGTMEPELRARFAVTAMLLASYPDVRAVLCPLPRIDEIAADVDALPQARYFHQSAGGIHVREAVLRWALAAGA